MRNIFIILLIFLLSSSYLKAQEACMLESEPEAVENEANTNIDIGEKIQGDESDFSGSDLAEGESEFGLDAGEDLSTSIGDDLVSFASDVFGPAGTLTGALLAGIMIDELIIDLLAHAHIFPKKMPFIPEIPIAISDLESDKDSFSTVFFIDRLVDEALIRDHYFPKYGYNSYIGQHLNTNQMSDELKYAFTKYYHDGDLDYERSISPVTFSSKGTTLYATIINHWEHRLNTATRDYTKDTSYPVTLNIMTKNDSGEMVRVRNSIPYVYKIIGDRIQIEVSQIDISGLPLQKGLYLTLATRTHTYFTQDCSGCGYSPCSTMFPTDIEVVSGCGDDSSSYYPTTQSKKDSYWQPRLTERVLYFGKIIDFQPVDDSRPITQVVANPNAFPNIPGYNFTTPFVGHGNLEVNIPVPSSESASTDRIEHVEIDINRNGERKKIHILGNYHELANGNTQVSHFTSKFQSKDELGIPQMFWITDEGNSLESISEGLESSKSFNEESTIALLIRNSHIKAGDIVDVKTYYRNNSMIKIIGYYADVNPLARAYYTIQDSDQRFLQAKVQESDSEYGFDALMNADAGQWFIEHQASGAYTIMNKVSKKALGINDGDLGLYDWEEGDLQLLWQIDFANNNSVTFGNLGYVAYLTNNKGLPGYTYSPRNDGGIRFYLEHIEDASPILTDQPTRIFSKYDQSQLRDLGGNPVFEHPNADFDQFDEPEIVFRYHGGGYYSLKNVINGSYLNQNGDNFYWDSSVARLWHIDMDENGFFSIKNHLGYLKNDGATNLSLKIGQFDKDGADDDMYLFSINDVQERDPLVLHYKFDGNLDDSSIYAHHAVASDKISYELDPVRKEVVKFNEKDNFIDTGFGYGPENYHYKFSVSFWVKTDAWESKSANMIDAPNWAVQRAHNAKGINFLTRHSNWEYESISTNNLVDGKWHQIVIVFDGEDTERFLKKTYIDGRLSAEENISDASSLISGASSTVIIGNTSNRLKPLKGYMDDLKFYAKVLSPDEVAETYQSEGGSPVKLSYYHIANYTSAKVLHTSNSNVEQQPYSNTDNSFNDEWLIIPLKDEKFLLKNRETDEFIRISQDNVSTAQLEDSKSFQFLLETIGKLKGSIYKEYYQIKNVLTGDCIVVDRASTQDGANIKVADRCYGPHEAFVGAQMFKFGYTGNASEHIDGELLVHYKFDGNSDDYSEYKHHGTAHAGLAYINDSERGTVAQFDGVDDYMDTNTDFNPSYNQGDMTFSLWMKTNDWGSLNTAFLIKGEMIRLGRYGYQNKVTFNLDRKDESGNNLLSDYVDGINVADNEWHHIASVLDAQNDGRVEMTLYVDGIKINSKLVNAYQGNETSSTYISLQQRPYKGFMDDIKIWKKALSPEEIAIDHRKNQSQSNYNLTLNASLFRTSSTREEIPTLQDLVVYPNESNGRFNIGFNLTESAEVMYRIVDFSGRQLKADRNMFPNTGRHIWEIIADHLSAGTYIIEVKSDQWLVRRKLVIKK